MVTLPDLRAAVIASLPAISGPPTTDALTHELQVHQLELEIQNDELKRMNRELEIVNAKYMDLYEFSPVGFLTLTDEGLITTVNLKTASLLGVTRATLNGHRLEEFICQCDQDRWYIFFRNLNIVGHRSIEIKLNTPIPSHVLIQCITSDGNAATDINFSLTDVTVQNIREASILSLAYHDALTKLPNRRLLTDRIEQEMLVSNRHKHYSSLIFLDLDNFKQINDTHGHDIGDFILIEVANRLSGQVRDTDTVARLGGDEFVILCNNVGITHGLAKLQILSIAEKIKTEVARMLKVAINDIDIVEFNNTVSIGAVIFTGTSLTVGRLLKHADTAMYRAKQAGRNAIEIYNQQ
jgi:diguanylate cyclase (GGDEF)-like protein